MDAASTIVGHGKQQTTLLHDIATGNLAHAYLFSGEKHLGKFTVAKWFAAEILTQGQSENEKQATAQLLKKNVHPDLLILDQLWIADVCTDWKVIARSSNVLQEERAKKKVKTDTIGIDDVRELQRRLHETAQKGRLCCLVRSLERLQTEAANALLKILEEPPPHVLFCCTTESLSSLLPTVVSRMRVVEFSPLAPPELSPLLSSLPEEDRLLLLTVAQGSPGIIFRALDNPDVLREIKQQHILAHRFLGSHSLTERFHELLRSLEAGEERLLIRHLLLHLSEELRSEKREQAEQATSFARSLFSLLHLLQSNPSRPLLSAYIALQSAPLTLA